MEKNTQTEPSGELQRLRDRSGQQELSGELKRSLFGGVSRGDVLAYVEKLRDQWHSAEQTYKAYIADLSREKETLRQERDALEGSLAEQLTALARAQEAADPLNHPQVLALYEQARQSEEQLSTLRRTAEAAQTRTEELEAQLDRLLEDQRLQEARLQAMAQREASAPSAADYAQRCARYEEKIAELNTRLSDQLYELSDATARIEEISREAEQREAAQREQTQAEACQRLAEVERARQLETENQALSHRLSGVADALQAQACQLDDAHVLNARLKESMSSLLVKAEALMRENELLSTQLHGERERVAQVQAIQERLVDMLTRLRMAHQLLGERMADVDRAVGYGGTRGGSMPPPTAGSRRMTMEPLNLDGGGSSALYDMMQELNNIQATLSQIPAMPEDSKPNIRYSMEKLEVDCPGKKDSEPDAFRLNSDYETRNRMHRE